MNYSTRILFIRGGLAAWLAAFDRLCADLRSASLASVPDWAELRR
jgi:hypothetical protein